MNEKTNEDNNKKEKSATKGVASESGSKGKDAKADTKAKTKVENAFCKPPKINLSKFDISALYARVESLLKGASQLDTQVTNYAGDIYLKVKKYFMNTIESYKK